MKGKAVTFLLDDRGTNLAFARCVSGLIAEDGNTCSIFDVDALYASNSERIFGGLDGETARRFSIYVPAPDSKVEEEFPRALQGRQQVVIVDSLNSLHHLLSYGDGSSRARKLSFAVASLSYSARTNGKTAILTMYRREGLTRTTPGRSISGFSDATVSVENRKTSLLMKCERGSAWPGGSYSTRIPSG